MGCGERMQSEWIVLSYEDDKSNKPVEDYIAGVNDPKEKALLLRVIKLLETLGPNIQGTNMDKLIEGSIRELRKGRHRVLYGRSGNAFVLLTAFLKSSQKTPPEQISIAKRRFEEYQKTHS
jgi:phage-related protein